MKKYNIGFTCSAFDLLHAGHVLMLEEAKSICEHLIVGLQVDPSVDRSQKRKPIQSIVERQIQLSAVKYVDDVIVYSTEQDLVDLLRTLPINVRIVGEDYKNKNFTGKELMKSLGIDIYYNSRSHKFSTTELRDRVLSSDRDNKYYNSSHYYENFQSMGGTLSLNPYQLDLFKDNNDTSIVPCNASVNSVYNWPNTFTFTKPTNGVYTNSMYDN